MMKFGLACSIFTVEGSLGSLRKIREHVQQGTVYRQELENFQNSQYYGDLEIGEQKIKGIFDTGSFELLVLSSRCEHCRRKPYDYHLSNTYAKNGTMVKHVFGSGPVVSMQAYDKVEVGQMDANRQCFWEIVDHNIPVLEFAKFSAIVGIGHGYAPTNKEKTLVMNYNINEFSVCLEKKNNQPGWLFWGPTLTEQQRNEMTISAEVVGENHWGVQMADVTIGTEKLLCDGGGCGAIVDSGTSLLAAPSEHLELLTPLLNTIKEDCSNLHELPMLYLTLGGHQLALPPKAYVMQIKGAVRVSGDVLEADKDKEVWDVLFFKPKIRKTDMCLPAFMQLDKMSDYGPVWILGMPFLRYYYTQFNRSTKHLYFARASATCDPLQFEPVTRADALLEENEEDKVKTKVDTNHQRMRDLFLQEDDELDIPLGMDLRTLLPPMWDLDKLGKMTHM